MPLLMRPLCRACEPTDEWRQSPDDGWWYRFSRLGDDTWTYRNSQRDRPADTCSCGQPRRFAPWQPYWGGEYPQPG